MKNSFCKNNESGSTRCLSKNVRKETLDVQVKNGCHPKTSGARFAMLTQNENDVLRSVIVSLTKFGNKIPNDSISEIAAQTTINNFSSPSVFV